MKKVNKMRIIREADFEARLDQIPTLWLRRVTLGKPLDLADAQFLICKMGLTIPILQS